MASFKIKAFWYGSFNYKSISPIVRMNAPFIKKLITIMGFLGDCRVWLMEISFFANDLVFTVFEYFNNQRFISRASKCQFRMLPSIYERIMSLVCFIRPP